MLHAQDDCWPVKTSIKKIIDNDENQNLIAEAEGILAQWQEFLPVEAELAIAA